MEDRRIEAAAIQLLEQGQVELIFSTPKKERREELVSGSYFSWKATTPPTMVQTRSLGDIIANKDTATVHLNGSFVTIPRIVHDICDWLIMNDKLGEEGVFRKSGNSNRVQPLLQHIDGCKRIPADKDGITFICHDVIHVLKAFIRHIPGGITNYLFRPFLDVQKLAQQNSGIEENEDLGGVDRCHAHRRAMTMCLCYLLPKENQDLLKYLMDFIVNKVVPAQHQKQTNPMSMESIAKVLAPSLFPCDEKLTKDSPQDIQLTVTALLEIMESFKGGLLFNYHCSKNMSAIIEVLTPEKARAIYKEKVFNRVSRTRRRRRSSGLGISAIKSGIKQLQRKNSFSRNSTKKNADKKELTKASFDNKMTSTTRSFATTPSSMSTTKSSFLAPSSTLFSSPKRSGAEVHNSTVASTHCNLDDNEDNVPKRPALGTKKATVVSAAEAKEAYSKDDIIDPRKRNGKSNAASTQAPSFARRETGVRRYRRRSVEAARRFGEGISDGAKKMKKFMNSSIRKSVRKGTEDDSLFQTGEEEEKLLDDKPSSTNIAEQLLDLMPESTLEQNNVVRFDELHQYAQMCFDMQSKIESKAATSAYKIPTHPTTKTRTSRAPRSRFGEVSAPSGLKKKKLPTPSKQRVVERMENQLQDTTSARAVSLTNSNNKKATTFTSTAATTSKKSTTTFKSQSTIRKEKEHTRLVVATDKPFIDVKAEATTLTRSNATRVKKNRRPSASNPVMKNRGVAATLHLFEDCHSYKESLTNNQVAKTNISAKLKVASPSNLRRSPRLSAKTRSVLSSLQNNSVSSYQAAFDPTTITTDYSYV
eukprot:m.44763 g.44763  ORF g.44763 m.44763 type:complete len:816 (-) comp7187_c0_seq3:1668-4115(-)